MQKYWKKWGLDPVWVFELMVLWDALAFHEAAVQEIYSQ